MEKEAQIVPFAKWLVFFCFVFSGAASISYEMLWLRQAMTYFGVISPVISTVLSVFMAGLAAGTYLSGKLTSRISPATAIRCYATIELIAVCYALAVPALFENGYHWLLNTGTGQSGSYLLCSWAIVSIILFPVCTILGCTFPLLMHYLRGFRQSEHNFSFLYYANLCGGALGCVLPLITIERYGFATALHISAAFNIIVGLVALGISLRTPSGNASIENTLPGTQTARVSLSLFPLVMLFLFGFVTMGSEVLWIRSFVYAIGPTVYSFASILLLYLIFTAAGTDYYRFLSRKNRDYSRVIMVALPVAALMPVISGSAGGEALLIFGILGVAAFSFCLGYLTPQIIERLSLNDAHKASIAYLCNFAGCILGPLCSTYILFFYLGIKGTLIFYAVILFALSLIFLRKEKKTQAIAVLSFLIVLYPVWNFQNMEGYLATGGRLERDHVGYIGAYGEGMDKRLFVNGISMTHFTSITKVMAHLPMAHRPQAKSALAICFGAGTTLRSLASWPLEKVTVAELSVGVTKLFDYFFDDAGEVRKDPRVHIVVDDGRRFLNRTHELYDIITIDPPPPISSSGSGLLYTTEFISILKQKLAPGGMLAHWIFFGGSKKDNEVYINATLNAIKRNFRYVKLYDAIKPGIGVHVLASDSIIPELSPLDFERLLPPRAKKDIMEWEGQATLADMAKRTVNVVDESKVLNAHLSQVTMTDDRLYNEFYLLHTLGLYDPAIAAGN